MEPPVPFYMLYFVIFFDSFPKNATFASGLMLFLHKTDRAVLRFGRLGPLIQPRVKRGCLILQFIDLILRKVR